MTKFSKNSKRLLGAAAACALLVGWSVSSQAQTCTVSNWAGGPTNLTDDNTGIQGEDNRRYAGPCGLRVPVDGTPRFVTDNSPASESTYIARFYVFLDNAGSDEIVLFSADDGTNAKIQVLYNAPTAGDLTLQVIDSGDGVNELTFEDVGTGWHSVEFDWAAAASATIAFSLNGSEALTSDPLDTSGIALANSNLGNVGGANTGGTIDFDDFDSRRTSRPGRLCRGDINADGVLNQIDLLFLQQEVASAGANVVDGQPDYNEDGVVNQIDLLFVQASHVAVNNPTCPQ